MSGDVADIRELLIELIEINREQLEVLHRMRRGPIREMMETALKVPPRGDGPKEKAE